MVSGTVGRGLAPLCCGQAKTGEQVVIGAQVPSAVFARINNPNVEKSDWEMVLACVDFGNTRLIQG